MKISLIVLLFLILPGCNIHDNTKTMNNPPIANAGEDFVGFIGDEITLDGSLSTGEANLTYNWSLISTPQGSSFSLKNANSAISTFIPDLIGEYSFRLTVSDGGLASSKDFIYVDITNPPTVTVAKWHDNMDSAISFDWDDSNLTHCSVIAPLFDKYDLKATFGVITDTWLECYQTLSSNGHEIASHSKSHKVNFGFYDVTNDEKRNELEASLKFLTQEKLIKPTLFIHPWNSIDLNNILYDEYYLFSRIHNLYDTEENYQANIISSHGLEFFIDLANKNNGWLKIAGHSVDGEGWQPIKSSDLEDFLAYLIKQNIWVDTHSHIALYQMARTHITANIKNGKIVLNDELIDYELLRSYGVTDLPLTFIIDSIEPIKISGYLTCNDYPYSGEGLMFDYNIMSQAELVYESCAN
ncbi:hypothetical protein GCM10009111_02220 [Colwellia asteriadis]|uniref:NodB homology domain-containing protein n=1 Tax=Colwellia asteriadis TaxID=517723 RepID=A0ABN1L2J3_9GAMM